MVRYLSKNGTIQMVDQDGTLHQVPDDDLSWEMAWAQGWRPLEYKKLNPGYVEIAEQRNKEKEETLRQLDLAAAGLGPPPVIQQPSFREAPEDFPAGMEPRMAPQTALPLTVGEPTDIPFGAAQRALANAPAVLPAEPEIVSRQTLPSGEVRFTLDIPAPGQQGPINRQYGDPIKEEMVSDLFGYRPELITPSEGTPVPYDPESVKGLIRQQLAAETASSMPSWLRPVSAFWSAFGRIPTMGLSDTGMGLAFSRKQFEDMQAEQRARQAEQKQYPLTTLAGEVAGALTPIGAPALAAKGVAQALAKTPLLARIAGGATAGAGIGVGQVVSTAQTGTTTVKESAGMIGAGATIGALFPIVGSVIGAIGKPIVGKLSKFVSPAAKKAIVREAAAITQLDTLGAEAESITGSNISTQLKPVVDAFAKGTIDNKAVRTAVNLMIDPLSHIQTLELARKVTNVSNTATMSAVRRKLEDAIVSRVIERAESSTVIHNVAAKTAIGIPKISKQASLPFGLGSAGLGVTAGLTLQNPIAGLFAGAAPFVLRSVLGSVTARRAATKILTGLWGQLGNPAALAATKIMSESEMDKMRDMFNVSEPVDVPGLSVTLQSSGWQKEEADSFALWQADRESGIKKALDMAKADPASRARASMIINGLNNPSIMLAKLQEGNATRTDMALLKTIMVKQDPNSWKHMENIAKSTLEQSKRAVVPMRKIALARMILGLRPRRFAKQSLPQTPEEGMRLQPRGSSKLPTWSAAATPTQKIEKKTGE